MKKRGYGSFALPRVIAGLLVGAIVFGITSVVLENMYNSAVAGGYNGYRNTYEKMLDSYDKGDINEMFISMYCNLFHPDYVRLARINDDGSFDTVFETDYDIIAVSQGIHEWYYVTNDEELLSLGTVQSVTRKTDFDVTIHYVKCDELWEITSEKDALLSNSYDATSLYDRYYTGQHLFLYLTELEGALSFPTYSVESYYSDDEYLYLGRVYEDFFGYGNKKPFGKEWDFTDVSKKDLYLSYTGDDLSDFRVLTVMPRLRRPNEFFEKESGLFLARNMDELSGQSEAAQFNNNHQRYSSYRDTDLGRSYGEIEIFETGGNRYLCEFVVSTVPYTVFYKDFLVIYAVVLLILGIGIPMIIAIRPYSEYRRAVENNEFKNNLIDSLAHNIKTPLQILGGYAENLKDVTDAEEKNRYADSILAKTAEMNNDIEMILKAADKPNPVLSKGPVRELFADAASRVKADIDIKGDTQIPMDKEYFGHAVFCLIDNAARYKTEGSKIEVVISAKEIVIRNKTDRDKFTPGTGIAIAGRIIEQHGLRLKTKLEGGAFEAKLTKK